jgi:alkylhydroperoxidase/carboxymuconolactone decarboxylase family protein YurZ
MVEDWLALIGNMNSAVRDLRQAAPEVMKTFSDMARAAHGGEALDGKTKELVALAIAVATRCSPCIPYHARPSRAPPAPPWRRPWPWQCIWAPAPR